MLVYVTKTKVNAILDAVGATMTEENNEAGPGLLQEFRAQFLIWFGIAGSAVALSGHWPSIFKLSDWMQGLVSHVSETMYLAWRGLGSLIDVNVPPEAAGFLSLVLFYASMTIFFSLRAKTLRTPSSIATIVFLIVLLAIASPAIAEKYEGVDNAILVSLPITWVLLLYLIAEGGLLIKVSSITVTVVFVLTLAKMFNNTNLIAKTFVSDNYSSMILGVFVLILLYLPFVFVPARTVISRMTFVLIGLAFILGVSEVSKLVENFTVVAAR